MKHLLLFSFLMCSIVYSNAQVTEPFFFMTIGQDDYTPLQNSESLNQGIPYDDPEYECPIGFSFEYLGHVYDSLIFGGLDGYGMECIFWEDFPSTPRGVMSPSMHDIIDSQLENNGKADSDIRYVLEGEPGTRIFKLEWSNVAFYNEGSPYSMRINNQMWLYEADNSIEFRYGPHSDLDYEVILDYSGVPVAFTRDFDINEYTWSECQALSGDPANPEFISIADYNAFDVADFLSAAPSEGVVYRFSPLIVNVSEFEDLNVSVFPNPASDWVRVETKSFNHQSTYTIFDHSGRVVSKGKLNASSDLIDVSMLSTGVYQLLVSDANQSDVTKLMIK